MQQPDRHVREPLRAQIQLGGGVDHPIGPGYLVGDLRFAYSSLDNVLTGSTNAGNLVVSVGYRLAL